MEISRERPIAGQLRAWKAGDAKNPDFFAPPLYGRLRRLAASLLRAERPGHTLPATAVVHEVWLRLSGREIVWRDRRHFLGLVARLMRQVLVDHARCRQCIKRGGKWQRVHWEEALGVAADRPASWVALDDALTTLERRDPLKAALVELRFFAGFSLEETAEILAISRPTAVRHWRQARAWLFLELGSPAEDSSAVGVPHEVGS